jgi:hypothetical protein
MLEDNQVLVQGMMANRYMATFRDAVLAWNRKLMAVADVVQVRAMRGEGGAVRGAAGWMLRVQHAAHPAQQPPA